MAGSIEQDTAVLVLGEVRDLPGSIRNIVGLSLRVVLNQLRKGLKTMEGTIDSFGLEDSLTIDRDRQGIALIGINVKMLVIGLDVDDNGAQSRTGGFVVCSGPVIGDHGVVLLLEHEVLVTLDGLGDNWLAGSFTLELDALGDLDGVGATLPVLGEGPDPGLLDGIDSGDALDLLDG